ncbi:hypothetical protein B4902_00660 [Yersinia frederiksenii]|uniref:hypothetical protein n=1 Tax=Yersinia frederiksenii TaxID=29484 RepID=UPI000B4965F4|nr:hypothetical protein [Yersinia frederiksenii]OWF74670.1 hypothetical protein B4902_00660 [Yersinia frederiksenii]
MINYLLTPPNTHFDYGFGISAEGFKESADILGRDPSSHFTLLPLNYLRRHAIELYLKSFIFILHRKYNQPFCNGSSLDKPIIMIGSKSKPLSNIHDLSELYEYFISLHERLRFDFPKSTIWDISNEIRTKINFVNGYDSQSTYFRYPISSNSVGDAKKSRIQPVKIEHLIQKSQKNTDKKIKCVLMFDENDELVETYDLVADTLGKVQVALESLCDYFHNLHAAYRFEITKGN